MNFQSVKYSRLKQKPILIKICFFDARWSWVSRDFFLTIPWSFVWSLCPGNASILPFWLSRKEIGTDQLLMSHKIQQHPFVFARILYPSRCAANLQNLNEVSIECNMGCCVEKLDPTKNNEHNLNVVGKCRIFHCDVSGARGRRCDERCDFFFVVVSFIVLWGFVHKVL